MIKRSARINGRDVSIQCADALGEQASFSLDLIKGIERDKGPGFLRDGTRLQVGWSILTLRSRESALIVCEPDFDGDPFKSTRDDVSCTLLVQAQQNDTLRGLGLSGVPVSFQDKIVLAKGCLGDAKIYLERKPPTQGDSGWFIGRVDKSANNKDLEAVYVYQLLKRRAALMKILLLPPGFLIVFEGDRIESILDDKDQSLLPARTPSQLN